MKNIFNKQFKPKYIVRYYEGTQISYGDYWVCLDFPTLERALSWMNALPDSKKKSAEIYLQQKTKLINKKIFELV